MKCTAENNPNILLVDDEPGILEGAQATLEYAGLGPVAILEDSRAVLPQLERHAVKVIVLDLSMPYVSGTQLLSHIQRLFPDIAIIVMTASQDVDTAVVCMKEGAFDFLVKPVEKNRLILAVKKAMEIQSLRQQLGTLKHTLLTNRQDKINGAFSDIITDNAKLRSLFHYIHAVAGSGEPLLITGETGVGKELFAQAVHRASHRPEPFVTINVAGLDDTIFTDTLFGHKRGAFTGADQTREGLIAKAGYGTLFLDEIGDLSEISQVKLLRLMQEHNYYPLGSDISKKSHARIVLATNRNLQERIANGHFRADLYYRLAVHEIVIPPLREHKDDIPLLTTHFIEEAAHSLNKIIPTPPPELFSLLATYHFPGNVRELRAMVFDAVAQHTSRILSMKHFERVIQRFHSTPSSKQHSSPGDSGTRIHFSGHCPTLKEAENQVIQEALRRAKGNQGIAATLLGISRQALNRRLLHLLPDYSA